MKLIGIQHRAKYPLTLIRKASFRLFVGYMFVKQSSRMSYLVGNVKYVSVKYVLQSSLSLCFKLHTCAELLYQFQTSAAANGGGQQQCPPPS